MITLRLSEIAALLGLPPPTHDASFDAIVSDSRKVRYGSMFAALPGSQVDGHDFAASAAELGATALLLARQLDVALAFANLGRLPAGCIGSRHGLSCWVIALLSTFG